ncbi:MAG: (Fe-S)-binding protein, partial [Dehalococcoidia bacterium]
LENLGVNFVALGGLFACCSDINSVTGDAEASDKGARELMAGFAAFRPKKVLLGCSTCVYRLNKIFGNFISQPYDMIGLTQFLAEKIDQLKFKRLIKKRVTYQDACKLGRGMGDWESPRALIQAIPGIEFVEGQHAKDNTICCGGVSQITRYKYTKHMNYRRMEEVKALKADAVVTLDLGCHLALGHLENKYGIEVINLWNLLGEALGFDYEDKLKKYRLYEDAEKVMAEAKPNLEESHYDLDEVRRFWLKLMEAGF